MPVTTRTADVQSPSKSLVHGSLFVLPIDDLEGTDIQQSVIATLRLASSNGASISPSIFERRTVSV